MMAEGKRKQGGEKAAEISGRWLAGAASMALVGGLASLYSIGLHLEHQRLGSTDAACNINATISCDAAVASPYSEVLATPLGVWGLGYFICILLALALLASGRGKRLETFVTLSFLTLVGTATSLLLAGLSWFVLKVVCLACLVVYGAILGLALLLMGKRKLIAAQWAWGPVLTGSIKALAVIGVVVGSFHVWALTQHETPVSAITALDGKEAPSQGGGEGLATWLAKQRRSPWLSRPIAA